MAVIIHNKFPVIQLLGSLEDFLSRHKDELNLVEFPVIQLLGSLEALTAIPLGLFFDSFMFPVIQLLGSLEVDVEADFQEAIAGFQ